jgi:hypothetical protein
MTGRQASPPITHIAWGQVVVEDNRFKDAKLYPGGAREWDWQETGTNHTVGIQPADVEELLVNGAQVVILSRGFEGRLQISAATLAYLQDREVPFHILLTSKAVELYGLLREETRVGALIHSTC